MFCTLASDETGFLDFSVRDESSRWCIKVPFPAMNEGEKKSITIEYWQTGEVGTIVNLGLWKKTRYLWHFRSVHTTKKLEVRIYAPRSAKPTYASSSLRFSAQMGHGDEYFVAGFDFEFEPGDVGGNVEYSQFGPAAVPIVLASIGVIWTVAVAASNSLALSLLGGATLLLVLWIAKTIHE